MKREREREEDLFNEKQKKIRLVPETVFDV